MIITKTFWHVWIYQKHTILNSFILLERNISVSKAKMKNCPHCKLLSPSWNSLITAPLCETIGLCRSRNCTDLAKFINDVTVQFKCPRKSWVSLSCRDGKIVSAVKSSVYVNRGHTLFTAHSRCVYTNYSCVFNASNRDFDSNDSASDV